MTIAQRCAVLLAALGIALAASSCGPAAVTFPDPSLEAAIREAIGKPEGPIHPADLSGLMELSVLHAGIADLGGIENCVSLTRLSLVDNQVEDISPLASLTKLRELNLWNNRIDDISPLMDLGNLRTLLILEGNPLSDESREALIPQIEERAVEVH